MGRDSMNKKPRVNSQNSSGYILVLALMIISATLILVNQLFQHGQTHNAYTYTMIDREKAKSLAQSGMNFAISQLQSAFEPIKEDAKKREVKKNTRAQQVLETIFPGLNRWQLIELNRSRDGIDGEIKFCLSCEDGKINLNQIFDFEKKKFRGFGQSQGDMQEVMKVLMQRLSSLLNGQDLFVPLLDFLSKRGYQLNEVTELLSDKTFGRFFKDAIFYQPPVKGEKNQTVYLTDLFTIWSDSVKLEPRFLSDSLSALLGLKRVIAGGIDDRSKQAKQLAIQLKQNVNWATDWDKTLKSVYNRNFAALPKNSGSLLNTHFDPTTFSVIASGKVGRIEQRLFAIIKKQQVQKEAGVTMRVLRLYWI